MNVLEISKMLSYSTKEPYRLHYIVRMKGEQEVLWKGYVEWSEAILKNALNGKNDQLYTTIEKILTDKKEALLRSKDNNENVRILAKLSLKYGKLEKEVNLYCDDKWFEDEEFKNYINKTE